MFGSKDKVENASSTSGNLASKLLILMNMYPHVQVVCGTNYPW